MLVKFLLFKIIGLFLIFTGLDYLEFVLKIHKKNELFQPKNLKFQKSFLSKKI